MEPPARLSKLAPLVDVVFRRLFEKPEHLINLLNALLHLSDADKLVSLTVQPTQISGPLADDKEVVLDIRARTRGGRHMHIEVQIRAFVSYAERMLYYLCGMYHGQLKAGDGYGDLRQVVSVHILGFRFLPDDERLSNWHHIFELRERTVHHRLSDHLQIHTIELPKLQQAMGEASTDETKWLYYLQHGHEMTVEQIEAMNMPEIERADKDLERLSQDRDLRILYEQRRKAEFDALSWKKDWMTEGLRLGRQEGHKEGLDEGRKAGLDEGRKAGLDEGRKAGLDEGRKAGLDEGRKAGLDEGRKAGLDAGRKAGRQEGLDAGKRLQQVESLLLVLNSRGIPPDEAAKARIRGCPDLAKLQQWFARALHVSSADEIFSAEH